MEQVTSGCLACGGVDLTLWATTRDIEYFSLPGDFRFYRCGDCEALSIDPLPKEHLALLYPENYYSFDGSLDSPVYRVKEWLDKRMYSGLLSGLPGESLSALDVGGGTGFLLDVMKRIDPRIEYTQVVDLDPTAADGAEQRGHHYFCGPIEEFQSERSFDLILMLNLIEHVADPMGVLESAAQMLSPKGVVVIKTPNYDSLDARIFRHRNWAGYHCPRHWVLFTEPSFRMCAERAGLRVRTCKLTQGASFWAGSVINWLSVRGLAKVSKERPMLNHPLQLPLMALFAAFDLARSPFSKTSQMVCYLERA